MSNTVSLDETVGGYRHEALLYSGMTEFLAGTLSFVRKAVDASDPVLVVISESKVDLLQRELGADAGKVTFADMAEVGDNPGRIIAAWRAFLQAHDGTSQLWGVGEPINPERCPAELAECQLHEALLNVAFDASTPFWLLCPYDLEALAADVIDEAQRTHPYLQRGDKRQPCQTFRPVDLTDPFARPLLARPAGLASVSFQSGGLRRVRQFVADQAQRAGLDQQSATGMVQAVNEIATNSVQHGGGHGEIRAWIDGRSLVCEVSDLGHITVPLVGRLQPALTSAEGGLWLANQLCDLVQIHSSPDGTAVRVYCNL